uniref:Uncharacterized protein n=1 Tax=Romanomermis culicivorax TaxID=13658 RepID=A0A915HS07_ROMCU
MWILFVGNDHLLKTNGLAIDDPFPALRYIVSSNVRRHIVTLNGRFIQKIAQEEKPVTVWSTSNVRPCLVCHIQFCAIDKTILATIRNSSHHSRISTKSEKISALHAEQ